MLHLVTNNIITKRDSGNGIMLVLHKYVLFRVTAFIEIFFYWKRI
jgi:hypothetical protein